MERNRFELEPGLWLDAERAVWLEEWKALVVADLHLGYAWAHRASGQLMPLSAREDSADRLLKLLERYRAEQVILLGDIVHRAADIPELHSELRWLALSVGERARLRLIGGNHDRQLAATLAQAGIALEIADAISLGPHLLLHGDEREDSVAATHLRERSAQGGRVILGHEHPAITISDGVASRAKCPCFLAGPGVLVLPAFSPWAAGSSLHHGAFLSPYARLGHLDRVVAIIAEKLLPIPLSCADLRKRT